jgi:hypothetical protein
MRPRFVTVLVLSVAALVGGSVSAVIPSSAAVMAAQSSVRTPSTDITLPAPVSQSAVSYTPNVYAGTSCGKLCKPSTVYSTAVVNGEVVVAGAFTEVCSPADTGYADCPTDVTRDYMFAFNLATGAIDPDFAPTVNDPVLSVVAGPDNTVYAGGLFTTVNGASAGGIVQLNVDPGQSNDGTTVSGFTTQTDGAVNQLALNGSALYLGGTFDTVNGTAETGVARVNATTGAVDTSFSITLGDPITGTTLQVLTLAVTPNGDTLGIGGSFQTVGGESIPRVALINTGGGLGSTATVDDWTAPVLANPCFKEHDYVNAIDFSPDGSFFVVADTGYKVTSGAGICDAVARFETDGTGTDIQPTWVNYSGGDSFHSVAIVGNVVYAGGHNRWTNNECGSNRWCEQDAALVNGLSAIDANTGQALVWWHPGTSRGVGVSSLIPFPAGAFPGSDGGLIVGTDVDNIGGAIHHEIAIFPMTTTTTPTPGGPIMSGMFSDGRIGGQESTEDGIAAMCVEDAGDGTTSGSKVQFSFCNNSPSQNWTIEANDTIQINGLCLATQSGIIKNGTATVVNTCNGETNQEWVQGPGNTLVNQAANLCLNDLNGNTSDNIQLQIHTCNTTIEETWPLPVAQAPPTTVPVGPIFSQLVQKSTQVPCLYDSKGKTTAGNPIVIASCDMDPAQTWTINSNGTIEFDDRCMDTSNPGAIAGSVTILNPCDGDTSQEWAVGTELNSIVNEASGLCLVDPDFNTANGTQFQIQDCTGAKDQQWHLPVN